MLISWCRYGGYECSTHGDKRFSAFCATMPDGRSIEMHYQCDVKGYDPGGTNWRLGKGKKPLNQETDTWKMYLDLWRTWAKNNPQAMQELYVKAQQYNGRLSDKFATTSVNQARALAVILNETLAKE